jgi:hypothetical protein
MTVAPRTPGPASANLPGRKPRERNRGWCGVGYGDLNATAKVCDWSWAGPPGWPSWKWLMNEPQMALNAVSWQPICGDGWILERTLPWPMERQRARRTGLQACDAVMRCRS